MVVHRQSDYGGIKLSASKHETYFRYSIMIKTQSFVLDKPSSTSQ